MLLEQTLRHLKSHSSLHHSPAAIAPKPRRVRLHGDGLSGIFLARRLRNERVPKRLPKRKKRHSRDDHRRGYGADGPDVFLDTAAVGRIGLLPSQGPADGPSAAEEGQARLKTMVRLSRCHRARQ